MPLLFRHTGLIKTLRFPPRERPAREGAARSHDPRSKNAAISQQTRKTFAHIEELSNLNQSALEADCVELVVWGCVRCCGGARSLEPPLEMAPPFHPRSTQGAPLAPNDESFSFSLIRFSVWVGEAMIELKVPSATRGAFYSIFDVLRTASGVKRLHAPSWLGSRPISPVGETAAARSRSICDHN